MAELTGDQYMKLPLDKRAAVDDWLKANGLMGPNHECDVCRLGVRGDGTVWVERRTPNHAAQRIDLRIEIIEPAGLPPIPALDYLAHRR